VDRFLGAGAIHIVIDRIPSAGHSDAYFALAGALGGAVVVGVLGLLSQWFQSKREVKNRDFDFLRALLGDAAETLGAVRKSYVRLQSFWQPLTGDPTDRQRAAETEQREATSAARRVLDRLRLQFPPDDAIMAEYEKAVETADAMAAHYVDVGQGAPERGRLKELGDALGKQMDNFASLSRARVGPRSARRQKSQPSVVAGNGVENPLPAGGEAED
jgi:hypothetical protein